MHLFSRESFEQAAPERVPDLCRALARALSERFTPSVDFESQVAAAVQALREIGHVLLRDDTAGSVQRWAASDGIADPGMPQLALRFEQPNWVEVGWTSADGVTREIAYPAQLDSTVALDPIAELVLSLGAREAPPIAWVVRWSANEREPVCAAWEESTDPHAMMRLLALSGRRDLLARARPVTARTLLDPSRPGPYRDNDPHVPLPYPQWLRAVVPNLRRVVPVPPTLVELLAVVNAPKRARAQCANGSR